MTTFNLFEDGLLIFFEGSGFEWRLCL